MKTITFDGVESARFSRFAVAIIKHIGRDTVKVSLEGREPLTSRVINLNGILSDALLRGYRRSVVIKEIGTGFTYWAAGTNATSAIATIKIHFLLEDVEFEKLREICFQTKEFIPTLTDEKYFNNDWCFIDRAPNEINTRNAEKLISILQMTKEPSLLGEAALDLRSYADFLSLNIKLQRRCERVVISQLVGLPNEERYTEAIIALVELLGYIGTENSIEILRHTVFRRETNSHIIWAAVIALGRIPSVEVDEILLAKIKEIDTSNHIAEIRGDVLDSEWLEAALLLCLARRVSKTTSNSMEKIFSARLSSPNKVLQRYACLGLSRLYFFSQDTIDSLLHGLENSLSEVELGYFAMALVNTFKPGIYKTTWNNDRLLTLTKILEKKIDIFSENCFEPDKVWGLEYLADLASFLENNELASEFHKKLSNIFDDWRSYYYQSLSNYEEGENQIRNKNNLAAKRKFLDALASIEKIKNSSEYVNSIIKFRIDIISARIKLLDLFEQWSRAISAEDHRQLEKKLSNEIIQQYRRYSLGVDETSTFNRLSIHERHSLIGVVPNREKESISRSVEVFEVLKNILRFQTIVLSFGIDNQKTDNYLQTIRIVVNNLYNRNDFLRGHVMIIDSLRKKISEIDNIFESDDVNRVKYANTLNCFRDIVDLFSYSSWPMPSHMCMLSGLGRGLLVVRKEEMEGDGNEQSPFLLDASFAIVINIVATIMEMSTGGSTKASIVCELPNNEKLRYELPIVEGSVTKSFVIPPNIISSHTSTRLDFLLVFSNVDVIQESSRITVFIKRDPN